jgi:hypothetical protein
MDAKKEFTRGMHRRTQVPMAALLAAGCLLAGAGCGSPDPFSYVQVSGKITYDDGSPIPVDRLALLFLSQGGPLDAKTHPRPATAIVDRTTGEIRDVSSHKFRDGLVPGRHKVLLSSGNGQPLSPDVVPPEYCDLQKTPLEVDTARQPFILKVRKPR